ncbi:GyrI-like domain-containing protein [Demequina phytophila]|uniref:GyrI-like domain-containing protein n=1 Tax=Demequina phytophila TaxID=1638981 RepID=UPI000783BCDE|nr:GyrI-like domain-containing protein [Demequina phytophila]
MEPKVDLKRTLDGYRARRGELRVLDVPAARYLMVDGAGDPNVSPDFSSGVGALFPLAYAVKFASRRELGRDHVVMPLEGLWWAEDPTAFVSRDKAAWSWTLMVMIPEWIEPDLIEAARRTLEVKGAPARLEDVRVAALVEGRCVQTLHVGSFDDEGPLLARLHDEFLPAHGLRPTGCHHEIYLSDMRRTAPERRRTILRQPVEPAS